MSVLFSSLYLRLIFKTKKHLTKHTFSWFLIPIHYKRYLVIGLTLTKLIIPTPLFADWYYGLSFAQNEGKQILETGSKKTDINGFAGGSRLTYPRNFNYFGIKGGYKNSYSAFNASFMTTGWYVRTGTAQNEDFFLNEQSSIKESGTDYEKKRFRDTPYSITGSKNFAYAQGKSNMSSYDIETEYVFFPFSFLSKGTSPDHLGFFVDVSLQYTWFKYYIYDVLQYINFNNWVVLGPIGYGNSFSNAQLEYPVGIGYSFMYLNTNFKLGLQYINGSNTGKDFHKQRNLNFILSKSFGTGYNYKLIMERPFENKQTLLQIKFFGHHYYSQGIMTIKGGLGDDYLISLLGIEQGFHLSTKETGIELSILQKF